MQKSPEASIIIPTTRPECLSRLKESLYGQSFKSYELIVSTEIGDLSRIRNKFAQAAKGRYLIFTDDDVIYSRRWLEAIVFAFRNDPRLSAVTGPAVIPQEYKRNRDLFRVEWAKFVYDHLFCGRWRHIPCHITEWGAFSTKASDEDCDYEGEVMYTEACNMAFCREKFWQVGGFDKDYIKTSEWCEPDLCFRLRNKGYPIWFAQDAKLWHFPAKTGAYKRRLNTEHRKQNYERFSRHWMRQTLKHKIYKNFVNAYFGWKNEI